MPTSTLSRHPLSLSFDTLAPSYRNKIEQYADFSPALYSDLDAEDCGTDFTTDSAPSPGSSLSPAVTSLYALPQDSDWVPWDKIELSADTDLLKTEPFEDSILSSVPPRSMSLSPAVNPMDLTNPHLDDVLFGHEGIHDNQPLFQTQFAQPGTLPQPTPAQLLQMATQPQQLQQPQQLRQPPQPQQTQQPQQPQRPRRPSAVRRSNKPEQLPNRRHPRSSNNNNNLKRKSCPSEDDCHLSQRSSVSPPPNTRRSAKSGAAAASSSSSSDTTPTAPEPHAVPSSAPKKTAHNMIEKRYRNNLNDKIAALRDAVPALRVMVHRLEGGGGGGGGGGSEVDDDYDEDAGTTMTGARRGGEEERRTGTTAPTEDLGGLAPAHKLNKATILGKATEYILHLERRNRNLARENAALKSRMEGFEMLVMSRGGGEGMWN